MEAELLASFREEFQSFSQAELEEAVREARMDIQEELEQYQIYQTQQSVVKQRKFVSVPSSSLPVYRTTSESSDEELDVPVSMVSRLSEESESISEDTVPKVKTEKCRISYSLDQLEKIFLDIFKSLNVNKNYVAKDSIETERAKKRLKDFTTRFGRTLYQTKQNYISLKNLMLRSELSGGAPLPNLSDRLAQLFVSSRTLLSSYLHFIPLSAGNLFPTVLSDALDLILDIGNLTVSAGFSTNHLAGQVRELEELMSKRNNVPDISSLEVLNSLARSTFGQNQPTKPRARKSPRRASSGGSTIKPRSNKIFQQRTNIARLRRMKDIEQRETSRHHTEDLSKSQQSFGTPTKGERSVEENRRSLREQLQCGKPQETPVDMKKILKRLHNLELIASTEPDTASRERPIRTSGTEVEACSTDLEYLINRLEIIESDFNIIALKYNDKLKPKSILSTKCDLNDVKFFSLPVGHQKEINPTQKEDSRIANDKIEAIVNKVTDEILADDLLLK